MSQWIRVLAASAGWGPGFSSQGPYKDLQLNITLAHN